MNVSFSRIVDLSHEISSDMPIWQDDPKTEITTLTHEKYTVEKVCIGTHTGTHVGTPSHFGFDGSVENISVGELLVSCVVMEFSNPRRNFSFEESDVKKWEMENGPINVKAVILKTGQETFFNDRTKYFSNYPGFSLNAVRYLLKKGVRCFGTDAPGVDPWDDDDFLSNREIFKNGGIHLENLANLNELPLKRPFWIFIGALKMKTGGSPARIVAFV